MTMLLSAILIVCGCTESRVTYENPCDPNMPASLTEYTGNAADAIAEADAANKITEQGRIAAMEKHNATLYVGLIIVTVGGLAFWGFTRSRYGWVIPAASVGGIVLMRSLVRFDKEILIGVFVIVMGVLIWKAVEYQKERNAETKTRMGLEAVK